MVIIMAQIGVMVTSAWLLTTQVGAQVSRSDLTKDDIELLAIECQRLWQFDAIIFIRSVTLLWTGLGIAP